MEMNELIEKAKKGDKDSFTQIILMMKDNLYRIARMRFQNEDDINEVVQLTIIEVYNSLRKLRDNQKCFKRWFSKSHGRDNKKFKSWVIKILINYCNKQYKKKSKDEKEQNIEIDIEEKNDEIARKIDQIDFYNLIKTLDYKERLSLMLFYAEDLSYKEISKILKEPESTIRNRNSRAIDKLRKKYKEK